MMPFEESFPSLKEFMFEGMNTRSVFNSESMQKILFEHCLDKARVKEAIESKRKQFQLLAEQLDIDNNPCASVAMACSQLLEELGLEEK